MQKLCPASHVIEWNKRMEKHCHHYDYWGERGSFSHLDDTFNRHCNLGLSCPRTSIANDFMKPFARRCGAALSPVPCPLSPRAPYGDLLGLGPSPWLWLGVQVKARWAPSASSTHAGSAARSRVSVFSGRTRSRIGLELQLKHLLWSCSFNSECLLQLVVSSVKRHAGLLMWQKTKDIFLPNWIFAIIAIINHSLSVIPLSTTPIESLIRLLCG